MVVPKEKLTDYKEAYEKSLKLVNEESKQDPLNEPFRSHYAARDVLLRVKRELLDEIECEGKDSFTYIVILGNVCRDLGRIFCFVEEPTTGHLLFKECVTIIEPHAMKPEAIIPYVGALNEIGVMHALRNEHKEALELLTKSEQAYIDFKKLGINALAITDVFGTSDEVEEGKGPTELESLYTLCTFYLAQVYGHLGEVEKSAVYCHNTLKRQLQAKSYEAVDFALNAATLSQYYIGQNMFPAARHHLAVASCIMSEHERTMITPEMNESKCDEVMETFKHRTADIARCWAKYGLALLDASKERLYNDDETKLAQDTKNMALGPNSYRFPELQLTDYENIISADYCLTFEDAKPVYHLVSNWLDKAKAYYTLDTEASEYAKIIKDYAELFQNIAFFEENPVNQAKMHKRRAGYYEELLKELNPVFYLGIFRECWWGAGRAQCDILDIKLDLLRANRNSTPQDMYKINQICQRAIKHFQDFIKSYMEKDGITWRPKVDVEEQRNVLFAYFHLGRLYYKMITPDHALQLQNMENSLKYYKLFTDECAARKEAAETLQGEVGVCREMVHLLPLKIENVKKRLIK